MSLAVDAPRADWDAFLRAMPNGDIVQTSMWGLSKRAIGQTAVLVETRDAAGAIAGGALMIEHRIGPGIGIGYVPRGPVVRDDDPELVRTVVDELMRLARSRGLRAFIVQLPAGDPARDRILAEAGFMAAPLSVTPEATILIDVAQSDEAILGAMSTSRRRNVRQSWKERIEIAPSDDVAAFHRLHSATGTRKTLSELSLDYHKAQWQALAPSGSVAILLARDHREAVAGLWLSRFGDVVTLRLSGWNAVGTRAKHVNEALRWAGIRWTRSVGARMFDFGAFDRGVAEAVLRGEPLPKAFAGTHNSFKLGFNPVPVLLPKAQFQVFGLGIGFLVRLAGPNLLGSPLAHRFAQRLRSA
jgi:hypothetical protein